MKTSINYIHNKLMNWIRKKVWYKVSYKSNKVSYKSNKVLCNKKVSYKSNNNKVSFNNQVIFPHIHIIKINIKIQVFKINIKIQIFYNNQIKKLVKLLKKSNISILKFNKYMMKFYLNLNNFIKLINYIMN